MSKKKKRTEKMLDVPVEKDDGTRWIVVDENDRPVYLFRAGVRKVEAERLASGLLTPAGIRQVQ